jgi:hypothetical protein
MVKAEKEEVEGDGSQKGGDTGECAMKPTEYGAARATSKRAR